MQIETRWLVSVPASCWHAAESVARGANIVDRALASAVAPQVERLRTDLASLGIEEARFFRIAAPLSVQFDDAGEWAKAVLGRLKGPAAATEDAQRLARRFVALRQEFSAACPSLLDDLELRVAPLMSHWEARGPGLLAAVGRHTQPELLVERADVIAVHPILGGGGAAYWLNNAVCIEAVLANPIAELPEVLRLGWLLSQLHVELPRFEGTLHRDRHAAVWSLAMIPPVLVAGEQVELARYGAASVRTAISAWTGIDPQSATEPLMTWWDTYAATHPQWPVALGALDRLLIAG